MSIKIYDNSVPFCIRQRIYKFIINSTFMIQGWDDSDDLEIKKSDLHSNFSLEDLKNCNLYPYISKIHSFDNFDKCVVNLTKPGDYHYTHTHGEKTTVILYYANLEWRDSWAGETIFYDNYKNNIAAYEYTPGRLLKFNGISPHSIRPQSFNGPQYRFTVSTFFKVK